MLKLAVLIGFVAASNAIVCTPQLCGLVDSTPLSCPGKVIQNGGFCGCTDACAKQEGETCQLPPELEHVQLWGMPPAGTCDDNLECTVASGDDGLGSAFGHGVCSKAQSKRNDLTPCQQMRQIRMISFVMWQGMWTPNCDVNGMFEPEQCDNTNTCFCVTQNLGHVIESTKVKASHADCSGVDLTDHVTTTFQPFLAS